MRFDHHITFLPVADLERATEFYGGALGLPLLVDQGDCRIFEVAAGSAIGICRRRGRGDMTGLMVTLVTDDVDGWHRRLVAAGVPCDRSPARNEQYSIYQALYRDPDGHVIEIQRFEDPAWTTAGHRTQ